MVSANRRNNRDRRARTRQPDEKDQFTEKVVSIRRVSKVVKGGRNLSFSAFVVIGDENGKIGFSSGKATAVPDAVKKAVTSAKKDMAPVVLNGTTVPHEVIAKFGASKVMIKPASQGTGVIAGGGVRAVMEVVGIKDVISKTHGSTNTANVVKATVKALRSLKDIKSLDIKRKQNDG
jgi:small subunit ribosomal protein S5